MRALLGIGRLNAFRLNALERALRTVRAAKVSITLDGAAVRARIGSVQIHDAINDTPNTCTIVLDQALTVGQRLRVFVGMDPQVQVFGGPVQRAAQSYSGREQLQHPAWTCDAVDDTPRADWLRPFEAYASTSATAIAAALVAKYCPGYTTQIQPNLPLVDVLCDGTVRVNDALRLLAKLVGGYFYWFEQVLHLFTDPEPGDLLPDPIDGRPGQLLDDPRIQYTSDDAQIRTRCYGKGHEEATLAAFAAAETKIPIANAVMFAPAPGGLAISQSQRFSYTDLDLGGTGALVGTGVSPSAPPAAAQANGTGVTSGPHSYAYSWATAAGQTLLSPAVAYTVQGGAVPAPAPPAPTVGLSTPGPAAGTSMQYRMYISDTSVRTAYSAPSAALVSNGTRPYLTFKITQDMVGRIVVIERSDNGGAWGVIDYYGDPGWPINAFTPANAVGVTKQLTDATQTSTNVQTPPPATLGYPSQVVLSGIAVGPSGVTARRLYRTAAYGSSLQLLATIGDNTTTTYTDAIPDSSLGAAAPSSDTSGLTLQTGQVNPGATTMPVTSTVWARADGGWAIVGNGDVVLRYGGVSGNTLTGIPASGYGSIQAPVNYNSTITGAPMLLGVSGLTRDVLEGDPIAIWVQVDDAAAQSALAARVGGSGIIENVIVDQRRGIPSLTALCQADLVMYSRPLVTVTYTSFDPKSRTGRPVTVHLPTLAINQTLTITDVTIDYVGQGPARFHVTAGTLPLSLDAILRRLAGDLDAGF